MLQGQRLELLLLELLPQWLQRINRLVEPMRHKIDSLCHKRKT
jgi:hypothetical protein